MSVAVDLSALGERINEFPGPPMLITVAPEGKPHVVSVTAAFDDVRLVAPAGTTTSANVGANPVVTMLWPAPTGADYCLIVDGRAELPTEGTVTITPTRAVLHRVAGASPDLPGCIAI